MAKQIVVVVAHSIGADEAKEAIRGQMQNIQAAFGKFAKLEDIQWQGDSALSYKVSALGVSTPGTMSIHEDRVEIVANLPAILAPFSQLVENTIRRHATDIFEGRKNARQVAELARTAARDAGQQWAKLSEEERQRYRADARRQLQGSA